MPVRYTKPPTPEGVITRHIRRYLAFRKILHYKVWQGLGSEKGVSDIAAVLPGGRALYIEVKAPKGKLSEDQQNFIDNVNRQGGLAFMAKSEAEVHERLREEGY